MAFLVAKNQIPAGTSPPSKCHSRQETPTCFCALLLNTLLARLFSPGGTMLPSAISKPPASCHLWVRYRPSCLSPETTASLLELASRLSQLASKQLLLHLLTQGQSHIQRKASTREEYDPPPTSTT